MTINQYRQALAKRPFQPFRIILADGRSFTIQHPEFAAMDPRGREVTFYEEDGTQHFIESMLIAEVVIPPTPEPSETR
ncbi:MAG: hypothetical protein ACLP7Q_15985 [Isosphaeraceae bacterium]